MTWVAAEPAGAELEGFGEGARVEYDLTDGTTGHGRIVVPGTDKVGSAHGIELDTDGPQDEMHWVGTILVRRERDAPAAPAKPVTPKLTPAQDRALDQLRGTLHGKIRKGHGIQIATARVLHRLGLAYLDETAFENGDWLLVLVEPERQTITDDELLDLPVAEAALLAPLDEKRRYRALRHAHIVSRALAAKDFAAGYPQLVRTRAEALRDIIPPMLHWAASSPGASRFMDLAGMQWKAARQAPTNLWNIGTGYGEPVLVVEAATDEEAVAKATAAIKADPVGYRELVKNFGRRRLTVQEWADARRVREAALAA